jgi:methylmalonyl-CoA epimerase
VGPLIGPIDHVGVAVTSLEAALPLFRDALGFRHHETETVETEKVRVAILYAGESRVELLEPMSAESPISKFLESRGPGIHHLAYRVADVAGEVERLRAAGLRFIEPAPRPGAQGCRVAFLHPKSAGGILTELVERLPERR